MKNKFIGKKIVYGQNQVKVRVGLDQTGYIFPIQIRFYYRPGVLFFQVIWG